MSPQELEQNLASLRDIIPRLYWAIYQGSLQAGFNADQAFAVLTAYILSQNPNGIQPSKSHENPKDD